MSGTAGARYQDTIKGGGGTGTVDSVTGSLQIDVDNTDPTNPVVHTKNSFLGTDNTLVEHLIAGTGVAIDSTNPRQPIVSATPIIGPSPSETFSLYSPGPLSVATTMGRWANNRSSQKAPIITLECNLSVSPGGTSSNYWELEIIDPEGSAVLLPLLFGDLGNTHFAISQPVGGIAAALWRTFNGNYNGVGTPGGFMYDSFTVNTPVTITGFQNIAYWENSFDKVYAGTVTVAICQAGSPATILTSQVVNTAGTFAYNAGVPNSFWTLQQPLTTPVNLVPGITYYLVVTGLNLAVPHAGATIIYPSGSLTRTAIAGTALLASTALNGYSLAQLASGGAVTDYLPNGSKYIANPGFSTGGGLFGQGFTLLDGASGLNTLTGDITMQINTVGAPTGVAPTGINGRTVIGAS